MGIRLQNKRFDLYSNKTRFNWLLVVIAIAIGSASVYYTNLLVRELKEREKRLIELYAKTLEFTANQKDNQNLGFFFQEIIVPNNSIPVILTDGNGAPIEYRNIKFKNNLTDTEIQNHLQKELTIMREEHEPIRIRFEDDDGEVFDYNFVYYKNSVLLDQLRYYPYVQLSIISIFGILAFMAFNYSKRAEQNRIWVGLAKETAHQLGTPISSLMAWLEYFRTEVELKDKEVLDELSKDISRLEMITSRFSNIGSAPSLNNENIPDAIRSTVAYLQKRLSSKITFEINSMPSDIRASINKPLFDWVIENLCKNAVDAMGGTGKIQIDIKRGQEGNVILDISDSGKGIPKKNMNDVFIPGYTTKSRGWGLGLTLVKRIIENYHQGRIFVKSSEPNVGTTFRIILKS
jgi:signal transduction histidine kinase